MKCRFRRLLRRCFCPSRPAFFFYFSSASCHLPVVPPHLRNQTGISLDWCFSAPPSASGTFPLSRIYCRFFLFFLFCFVFSFPLSCLLSSLTLTSLSMALFVPAIPVYTYTPFKRRQLMYCIKWTNCTRDFVLDTHMYRLYTFRHLGLYLNSVFVCECVSLSVCVCVCVWVCVCVCLCE